MPLSAESLTKESGLKSTREAFSASIEACLKEGGRDQKQCAAIAYSIARKQTGQELRES